MRSLYSHYRAPHLWSSGNTSTDPITIADCAKKLRDYGYYEHAEQLEAKLHSYLTPKAETVTVEAVIVEKPKRKRAKKERA